MVHFNHSLPPRVQNTINAAIFIAVLVGLYFTSRINYLLFHSLAEIFSIVVACSLFLIAWNSRQYIKNPYLLFIGIAYLFVGSLDLLHTLTYKGMPIFTDYDFYANQLWIGARYMESITLLLAFAFLYAERPIRPYGVFTAYTLATGLLIASVLYWKIFPECFIAGSGLTPFKKISEYLICLILIINIYLLTKSRDKFESKVFHLLLLSIICTIISELAFTFYVSNYGFSNLVGHYFKIFSFILVYLAIIKTGIEKPYDLVFHDLNTTNKKLAEEIDMRKKTEQERESLITELQKALDEIKTLKGILPLCSFCKKIRNDRGQWENVDTYIHKHSQADVSHGICPDCMKKHYPEFDIVD
ncbi:MAG: MASE3 domain-containing protein [Desulfobacteraceae bacterium]|jgi:hypothetical protein|nr:MASE3 domain-containing protein [Desulfobacteraceae bacterium]